MYRGHIVRASSRTSTVTIFGLVLLAFAALAAVIAIAVAMSADSTSVFDLNAGDCFVLPIDGDDTSLEEVDSIGCAEPHDAEVVLVGQLNPDQDRNYPTDEALFAEVESNCSSVPIPAQFGMLPIAPDEASWNPLAGRFLCVAVPFGGGKESAPVADF